MSDEDRTFPFSAVVGLKEAKLALRLAALDPLIGGVLLRGQKGSAKTTLARGLAARLGGAPFVELPLGATEDRVVGSLDTRAALTGGEIRFEPGLLADAHGGVLYVDEVNLLPDHLVDVLLDVAVSGENVVERDGVSHRHPARFVLIGSMNPEEGELRPQLLDRFGLCVDVAASLDIADRVEAVRRRLAFDAGSLVAAADDPESPGARPAAIDDDVIHAATRLALEVGAEGLRGDLTLCRSAAALAGLEGRDRAAVDDLRRVAPLVLAHRRRRAPFDPPVVPPAELEQAVHHALDSDSDGAPDADGKGGQPPPPGPPATRPLPLGAQRRPPTADTGSSRGARGRVIGDEPAGPASTVAIVPTLRAAATRGHGEADGSPTVDDLRAHVRVVPRTQAVVLCVDLSGSMGAPERATAASGTVLGLLSDAYERRHKVGLVTFAGEGATTVLTPTRSIEVARNRLDGLVTGGATPLAAGLAEALQIAERAIDESTDALIAVLTDGRATGQGGFDDALHVAMSIARSRVDALVLDCESGPRPLGLAAQLAEAMGARHVAVSELDALDLARHVSAATPNRR